MKITENITFSNSHYNYEDTGIESINREIDEIEFKNDNGNYSIIIEGESFKLSETDYYYIRKNDFKIICSIDVEYEEEQKDWEGYHQNERWYVKAKVIITRIEKENISF